MNNNKNMIVSNFINDKWIERLYMNVNKFIYLVKPDGVVEDCKIKKIKSKYYLTSSGKWFDNSGLPCATPADINVDNERNSFNAEIQKAEEEAKFERLKQKIIKGK
jgi:hypothetical protein